MPRDALTNEELSDEEIARMVTETIAWDSRIHYPEVRVTVEGAVVYLAGTMESLGEREAVEQDVRRLAGVTDVVSNLVVKPPQTVTDHQIAEDVRRALRRDARTNPDPIDVSVNGGVVTLSGEVVLAMEKWAALDAARHTYGVVGVVDQITVLPGPTTTDHMLADLARAELARAPGVEERRISVTVQDGVVTLRGDVDFLYQKHEAELAVADLPGIRHVKKEISVRARRS